MRRRAKIAAQMDAGSDRQLIEDFAERLGREGHA